MRGVSSNIDYYSDYDEHRNCCNLQGGKPVFYRSTVSSAGGYVQLVDPTEFTVSADVNSIHDDKKHPEDQAYNPGMPGRPESQENLSRN